MARSRSGNRLLPRVAVAMLGFAPRPRQEAPVEALATRALAFPLIALRGSFEGIAAIISLRRFVGSHNERSRPLCLPKIISGRNDGAARTRLKWQRWHRFAGPPDPGARLCPRL